MNNFIFSPSDNAFYPYSLKENYVASRSWPLDGIDIDDAIFHEFTGEAPSGKKRIVGEKGLPEWSDIPPMTQKEKIAAAEGLRRIFIEQANEYINHKQLPGKAALGRLKDNELAEYNKWLDYLDVLEALDLSSSTDITWPIQPV